jgi:hypothetical protein
MKKKNVSSMVGAGTGHVVGALKSTTSVGSKFKRFFVHIKDDFKSGYQSTKTEVNQDLPY